MQILRKISDEAVCVIAAMVLIYTLVSEARCLYEKRIQYTEERQDGSGRLTSGGVADHMVKLPTTCHNSDSSCTSEGPKHVMVYNFTLKGKENAENGGKLVHTDPSNEEDSDGTWQRKGRKEGSLDT